MHWFRFIVSDGASTAYYGDDTAALDGGLGATTATPRDWSYALTVYDPSFTTPAWAKNAVVYQIFPDRFRNGDTKNDPKTGDVQYDQTAVKLPGTHCPRATCRAYADTVPAAVALQRLQPGDREGPQGRDYYGGDLKGVRQSLEQLRLLGFNTIYLNPIFWSKSNHGYDTADYKTINPYFGTHEGVRPARAAGARAAHAHHPRRRLQPHVVGLAVLRPLPPLRDRRCVRVDVVRVSQLVRVHEHARAVHLRRLLGLVQLRLDPGARARRTPPSSTTSSARRTASRAPG